MDDLMLSEANRESLGRLVVPTSTSSTSREDDVLIWKECADELSRSSRKEDQYAASLRLYARLSKICRPQALADVSEAVRVDQENDESGPSSTQTGTLESFQILAAALIECISIFPAEFGVGDPHDYSDCSLLAEAILACLVMMVSRLDSAQSLSSGLDFSNHSLLSIVAYTDERDPWTTDKSAQHAETLLSRYLTDDRRADVIIKSLLHETIRPLFSRPSALLTASGRPSQFEGNVDKRYHKHHHDTPAWKKNGCFVISTFRFAAKSDSELIANHWPLYLPVVVSLAEDEVAIVREQGLTVMELFLETCPPHLIRYNGIGNVFRDTLFPTLLFLPSLTPEQESISLLRPAYRVLLKLAQLEPASTQKQQLLDKMIRDGIMAAFTHASQYIRIVQVLMDATEAIVKCMGVFAVKHIQSLLRLFSSIMTDPFAILYPPAVIAAAKALHATLINCWPRSLEDAHVESVIHTIVRCWLNVDDNHKDDERGEEKGKGQETASKLSDHDRTEIRQSLVKISKVLQSMWKQQQCGPPRRLQDLLQRKPQLVELFEEA